MWVSYFQVLVCDEVIPQPDVNSQDRATNVSDALVSPLRADLKETGKKCFRFILINALIPLVYSWTDLSVSLDQILIQLQEVAPDWRRLAEAMELEDIDKITEYVRSQL